MDSSRQYIQMWRERKIVLLGVLGDLASGPAKKTHKLIWASWLLFVRDTGFTDSSRSDMNPLWTVSIPTWPPSWNPRNLVACAATNNLADSEVLGSVTKVHLSKIKMCKDNNYHCAFAESPEVVLFFPSMFLKNSVPKLILRESLKLMLAMSTMMQLRRMEENANFGLRKR